MDELTDDELARLLGWTRVSFGAITFLAPSWAAKVWTGEDIVGTTAVMGLRSLGAREAALGLGLLIALKRGGPVRGWLEAGAWADAADGVNTLMARRALPPLRCLMSLAGSGAAVALGRRLAAALD